MQEIEQCALAAPDSDLLALRRARVALAVSGIAVIAFSVWSVIKLLLYFALSLPGLFESAGIEDPGLVGYVVVVVIMGVTVGVDLGVHIYVGRSALAEARGGKRGRFYIVLAIILIILLLTSISSAVTVLFSPELTGPAAGEGDTTIATIIFDIGALIALFDLVFSSLSIKRLTKRSKR